MNTTENNKLIAEFLGYVNTTPTDKDFNIYEGKNKVLPNLIETNFEKRFHTDWNWLMSVVEKIESIEDKQGYTFFVEISKERVHIKYYYKGEEFSNIFAYNYNGKAKIEIVYKACVEFVKWYNKQIS